MASSLYFGGDHDKARQFMKMTGMVPRMLDKGRFNRRLHGVAGLVYYLFMQIGHYFEYVSCEMSYVLDSFPVCDIIRILRARIVKGKQWHGRQTSMLRYFYGAKVQLLIIKDGIPVSLALFPVANMILRH